MDYNLFKIHLNNLKEQRGGTDSSEYFWNTIRTKFSKIFFSLVLKRNVNIKEMSSLNKVHKYKTLSPDLEQFILNLPGYDSSKKLEEQVNRVFEQYGYIVIPLTEMINKPFFYLRKDVGKTDLITIKKDLIDSNKYKKIMEDQKNNHYLLSRKDIVLFKNAIYIEKENEIWIFNGFFASCYDLETLNIKSMNLINKEEIPKNKYDIVDQYIDILNSINYEDLEKINDDNFEDLEEYEGLSEEEIKMIVDIKYGV